MRKRIIGVFVLLASVIACIVYASACKKEDKNPKEYVGKYEFVSVEVSLDTNGEKDRQKIEVGKDGIEKDFIVLELKNDSTYKIIMSPRYMEAIGAQGTGSGEIEGEWSVSDNKLKLHGANYENGVLSGSCLTFTSKNKSSFDGGDIITIETTLIFNKVVDDTATE